VQNNGNKVKTFKLTHVPAGTAMTVQPNSIFASDGPVPLTNAAASVTIIPSTLTLLPGQTARVTATFRPPTGLDKTQFPVFSGFIKLTAPSETYHVSYLGLAASLKDKEVIDNTDEFFGVPLPTILDSTGDVQNGTTTYTFVGDDAPTLLFRLAFGTPTLRVDLVDPKIRFSPTIPLSARSTGSLGPFFTFPRPHNTGTFAQVKIIGPLGELDFIPRNDEDPTNGGTGFNALLFDPTFANGTAIRNGSYRVLVRALRVTGDSTREEDYDSWLSPIIGVNVPSN